MNIKELRHKNYIQQKDSDKIWMVNDIFVEKNMISVLPNRNGECLGLCSINDFIAIILTEEWLFDFKFFDKDDSKIWIHSIALYPCDEFQTGFNYIANFAKQNNSINIRTVHQLQNLYFVLHNTELHLPFSFS